MICEQGGGGSTTAGAHNNVPASHRRRSRCTAAVTMLSSMSFLDLTMPSACLRMVLSARRASAMAASVFSVSALSLRVSWIDLALLWVPERGRRGEL